MYLVLQGRRRAERRVHAGSEHLLPWMETGVESEYDVVADCATFINTPRDQRSLFRLHFGPVSY